MYLLNVNYDFYYLRFLKLIKKPYDKFEGLSLNINSCKSKKQLNTKDALKLFSEF